MTAVKEFIALYPTYSRTKKSKARKGLPKGSPIFFPVIIPAADALAAFIHPSHLLE
jgi:malonyl CoA-acyl carrier protein transacylase